MARLGELNALLDMDKKDQVLFDENCIGAVARKMCNIIYAVVKNNQPYVPKA